MDTDRHHSVTDLDPPTEAALLFSGFQDAIKKSFFAFYGAYQRPIGTFRIW
jgi:hypothetical protein